MTATSQTPAGTALPSAGPATEPPCRGCLDALADEWNATATELDRARSIWEAQGRHDVAVVTAGRARQLNDCAAELRAALEET